jgi:hypothetical protein
MTNLLAIPLVKLGIEAGNNEDWVDSIKYVVNTGALDPPQLDIRGITFEMEIRREAAAHEVVLSATTADGTLSTGAPPDVGFLIFSLPLVQMQSLAAGTYVGDVTGRDEQYTRVIAQISLTIIEGVTKQPVNQRIVVQAA